VMLGTAFDTMETGGGSRWNNSISYNSPNWSGFDMRAIYSFGEQVGTDKTTTTYSISQSGATAGTIVSKVTGTGNDYDTTDAGKFGLGLRYANGPVYLTAIYQAVEDNDGNGTEGNKAWAIGGNYDFKVVKLYANYIREKTNDTDVKQTLWSLGVGVPVGTAGTIKAEYMEYKNDKYSDEDKAKGFGIGYEHDLSKRTRAYAYVSRITSDDNIAWGYSKVQSGMAGENNTNLQVGLRHFF